MIQSVLRDILLRPEKWMKVKVLSNTTTGNIEDADVEFEWICGMYGIAGNFDDPAAKFNLTCAGCVIPATNGLFDWYKSIYSIHSNNEGDIKSQDDPCSAFYTSKAAVIEHREAPPPPLEKRRYIIIEQLSKDAWFGERVESSHLFASCYPVGIEKRWEESKGKQLPTVYFSAQFSESSNKDISAPFTFNF